VPALAKTKIESGQPKYLDAELLMPPFHTSEIKLIVWLKPEIMPALCLQRSKLYPKLTNKLGGAAQVHLKASMTTYFVGIYHIACKLL
jgi:hypothetical protein